MLQIAENFALPIQAVTETFAILAKRGSGKTYTAKVMVEEMVSAGLPVAVVDPLGVWWGLRSSEDGASAGLPIVIFGGDHADVPLDASAGALVADVLIEEHFPAVLDLSGLSKSDARRFMTDFAERVYHRNREPFHLVLDEADLWAPQVQQEGGGRLLTAIEDIIRRGRVRGLGLTLITQRAAILNKNVLSQCEVLIALRMNAARDVAAVEEWISIHATSAEVKLVKSSLPSLAIGTAWIGSFGWLQKLECVEIRRARTFDSSATPKPGETRIVPREMAPVDLARLGERLAATLEKKASEDPEKLRERIKILEVQLQNRPAQIKVETREVRVEVPALSGVEIEELKSSARALCEFGSGLLQRLDAIETAPQTPAVAAPSVEFLQPTAPPDATPKVAPASAPAATKKPEVTPGVTNPQQRILDALAAFERLGLSSVTRPQLANWAKQSPNSSSFTNNLGALRSAGLLDYKADRRVALTGAGRARADGKSAPKSVRELHECWKASLPRPQAAILEHLATHYPKPIAKPQIAVAVGQSPNSSSFTNNLGALRSLGLIDYPAQGYAHATVMLFPDGLK